MSSIDYCSFIKIGEKEYMEKLLYEGEVFCNTIQYFNDVDHKNFRHDANDGSSYITQIRNAELFANNQLYATVNNAQIYFRDEKYHGNAFCLYGIATETLDFTDDKIRFFNLNLEGLNFGDTAILIFDPGEFLTRIKTKVEANGFKCQYGPVLYYDETSYEGNLSPFHKSSKYSLQNEVRIWIPNKSNQNLKFKIGDISDIAKILPKNDLSKLGYGN